MISKTDALWQVRDTLTAKGFRPDNLNPSRFTGEITVGHRGVAISIEVPDFDFVVLPQVKLLSPEQLEWEVVAHQASETGICYGLQGYHSLDPANPGAAVLRVLDDAIKALLASAGDRGAAEVADEYAAYWKGPRRLLLSESSGISKVTAFRRGPLVGGSEILLAADVRDLPDGCSPLKLHYLLIMLSGAAGPAGGVFVPKNFGELLTWLKALGTTDDFAKVCFEALNQPGGVIVSAKNGLFGVDFSVPPAVGSIKNPRSGFIPTYARTNSDKITLKHFLAVPSDIKSIVTRSLPKGRPTLSGIEVCLVGCGAIGGHLARLLAQLGAGSSASFTLVDPDRLAPENLGRHTLGFDSIGQWKSEALAAELRRLHPKVDIKHLVATAGDAFGVIRKSELLIDATGVENVGSQLNRVAIARRADTSRFTLFHTHLFGYGIAAQSFANLGAGHACYRCLRPDRGQSWRYDPRRDVSTDDTPVRGGCGEGAFLPYGPYAASAAASLCAQHIHDWILGIQRHSLRTLVLDPDRGKQIAPVTPTLSLDCPECQ